MIKRIVIFIFLILIQSLKLFSQCDSVRIENSISENEGDISYAQEVIHYSASGKVIDKTYKYQSVPGADWKVLTTSNFQYDTNDSVLNIVQISYFSTSQTVSGSEFTYDTFGNRLTGISYYNSNITSSDTNIYDTSNRLLEHTQNNYSIRINSIHTYDVSGKLLSDLDMDWNGSSWIDSVKTEYFYDGSGNLINHFMFENVGGIWDSTFIGYYFYNDSNLVDTFYTTKDSAGTWLNDSMEISTYGPLNKRTHHYKLKWNQLQMQWFFLSDDVAEVDSNGYPTLTVKLGAYYSSSNLLWIQDDWQIEEVYDSVGNLLTYDRTFPPYLSHIDYTYTNGVLTSLVGGSSSNMTSTDFYSDFYYAELFGDTLICQGGNPILNVDSCAGDSFLWSSGETTSSIIVTIDGNYQVTITRANGWVVQTPPVHVTLAPTLAFPNVLQGSDSLAILCPGNNMLLSTPLENGVAYQWFINGNALFGQINNAINLNVNSQTGEYLLIATNNCGSDSSSITQVYVSQTTLSADYFGTTCIGCDDGKINLRINTNYQPYSISIAPLAGVISGDSILYLPAGIYDVCVTDSMGCSYCVNDTITQDPTGVESIKSNYLKIYPNPVVDQLTISSYNKLDGDYLISGLLGNILIKEKLSGFITIVNLAGLSSGIYFLSFNSLDFVPIKVVKN